MFLSECQTLQIKHKIMLIFLIFSVIIASVKCQVNLLNYFGECHKTEETFDDCVKDGMNSLTPFFKTGLPDYGIEPFDPFFAAEVPQKRSGPFFNYKLVLRNVTESGWTSSQITKFKADFNKHSIQFTQFFPDKQLSGWYEIEGTILGNKVTNQGSWDLKLYDYLQSMTVVRKPIRDANGVAIPNPPLKVIVQLHSTKKLELHIGNLARGLTFVERILDWIINSAWQPGFVILSPLINDLVGTAFTEIFNRNFQNFPFHLIFPD